MSLLRPVIRACAVAALREQTWAGALVFDSDMTPLQQAVQGAASAPYIVVYTDADDLIPVRGQGEIYDGENRKLQLVLEIAVASSVVQKDGTIKTFASSPTDFGMELAVDVVCAQAMSALWGNPNSQWAELFKRFAWKLQRIPTRRGGMAQGIRFAARRIVMVFNTIYDFAPGIPPASNHPIWDFLKLAQIAPLPGPVGASGTITDMANAIGAVLATDPLPSWQQAQTLLGLTKWGVRNLFVPGTPLPVPGLEQPPLDWSDQDPYPPPFNEITLTGGGPNQVDIEPEDDS